MTNKTYEVRMMGVNGEVKNVEFQAKNMEDAVRQWAKENEFPHMSAWVHVKTSRAFYEVTYERWGKAFRGE